jgi:uncharacterized protein (TIGR03546 family)
MLALLKLLQSLVRTLHSDGTPAQIAAGFGLGAALGLTPLISLHNIFVFAALALLNVSFAAGLLGMTLFTPIGFLLDPLFDRVGGALLLHSEPLRPLWEVTDGTPVVAWFNLNNTVVLGSIVGWLVLFLPICILARIGVVHYRATLGKRLAQTPAYKAIRASRAYNIYRWFRE